MDDFFGNLATFLGGAVGGGIGFLILAFVILIGFIPLAIYMKQTPTRHTGLESFSASLDKPDQGWNDRFPEDIEMPQSEQNQDPDRITNQGVIRTTATAPGNSFPPIGEPTRNP